MTDTDELAALRAENARLIGLLELHGIAWHEALRPSLCAATSPPLSTDAKIALFRRLFHGRTDVYATRWESRTTGKSGYAPACANEWRPGICEKPRIKCAECPHRLLKPLTDAVIHDHLVGKHTVGIYPLLQDDTCYFLAVDFDEAEWQQDARAFMQSCTGLGVPAALEISRSGQGAHAWTFFSGPVAARDARRLGSALISHTCARTRQLKLSSYDRLFPNQDTLPTGGFGNLIALPLQKEPRKHGFSMFVDIDLHPYPDPWAYLATIRRMDAGEIDAAIAKATGGGHPLDVTFIGEEDLATPWQRVVAAPARLAKPLTIIQANLLYFEKADLPQALANRLIRLAAFQNPDFYRAQAMRLSVWNKPRVIGRAENFPQHIGLPRGCLDAALALLVENAIGYTLRDERFGGETLDVAFAGTLHTDQEAAVAAMAAHDTGVLCAPTGFGKTVVAAALIARRCVNTLILVHRTDLLRQWQAQLLALLSCDKNQIGVIGGGKVKPTCRVDIALMQSLSRHGEVNARVETYGQVIVDECHHVGAASFDAILGRTNARYVLGLTATPIRRDGLQPILFMQCGPIRYTAAVGANGIGVRAVVPCFRAGPEGVAPDARIQDVFRALALDHDRTTAIATEAIAAVAQGRKVLVLTERTEHVAAIEAELTRRGHVPFTLRGRTSKSRRALLMTKLNALPADAPRILLATGRLVGEGFDHAPLDTLILAMPISWKGTLQQYAGRLHRALAGKHDVCIVDFVDAGHPALLRMWKRRQLGYRAMGYQVTTATEARP